MCEQIIINFEMNKTPDNFSMKSESSNKEKPLINSTSEVNRKKNEYGKIFEKAVCNTINTLGEDYNILIEKKCTISLKSALKTNCVELEHLEFYKFLLLSDVEGK